MVLVFDNLVSLTFIGFLMVKLLKEWFVFNLLELQMLFYEYINGMIMSYVASKIAMGYNSVCREGAW